MALKFCPKCGNKLEEDTSFCDACGADLREKREAAEPSPPVVSEPTQKPKISPETVIYAPLLKRVIAIIFDSIIIGLIGSTFTWIIINPWQRINFFDPIGAWWFTFPFDWLLGFLYHWGLETYNEGQTIGKMALNIRTVDEKTLEQATCSNYAANNIFKGSFFLLLDLIIGVLKNSGDPKKE
jgi:uncharacterized RDD family membrane protein YckC